MTLATLLRRNLVRRKMRLLLTLVALVIAFLIFGVMGALQRNYSAGEGASSANRLVVANKIGFTEPLPLSYAQAIGRVEGVKAVSYRSMVAAYYQQERNLFLLLAVDPSSYLKLYPEYVIDKGNADEFVRDRSSMLVGETLAKRFGWSVGSIVPVNQRLGLQGDAYVTRRLRVAGIFRSSEAASGTGLALFHFAMFNEGQLMDRDAATAMLVQTADAAKNGDVSKRIDDQFVNSPNETSTQTEEAFSRAILAQVGDIATVTRIVVGAGFFSILLIVGSNMAATVRERRQELAVLRLLGFSPRQVTSSLLVESLIVVGLGGTIGMLLASFAVNGLRRADSASFGRMVIAPADLLWAVALVAAVGVAVVALPAWWATRTELSAALVRRQA